MTIAIISKENEIIQQVTNVITYTNDSVTYESFGHIVKQYINKDQRIEEINK